MLDTSFYLAFVPCSLCCYVLSRSPHSNLFLLTTCLKEKWTLCRSDTRLQLRFPCVVVSSSVSLISTHSSAPHFLCYIGTFSFLFLSFFISLFLSFFLSLHPSQSKGCMPLPLVKAPSHCKRMSLSHCKQSAFIMSYLPGPPQQQPWYQGRARVFVPVAGSRSAAQGNSTRAQGLFGELVLDLSIRLWRRRTGALTYPWSRQTLSLSLPLIHLSRDGFADQAGSFPAIPGFRFLQLQCVHINIWQDNKITRVLNLNINSFKCLAWGLIIINCWDERGKKEHCLITSSPAWISPPFAWFTRASSLMSI